MICKHPDANNISTCTIYKALFGKFYFSGLVSTGQLPGNRVGITVSVRVLVLTVKYSYSYNLQVATPER